MFGEVVTRCNSLQAGERKDGQTEAELWLHPHIETAEPVLRRGERSQTFKKISIKTKVTHEATETPYIWESSNPTQGPHASTHPSVTTQPSFPFIDLSN